MCRIQEILIPFQKTKMKFYIRQLKFLALMFFVGAATAADLRTSPGQPNIGDLYASSIPIDSKRKIILPDGVWQVNQSFEDRMANWHAAWRVVTLVNRDPESPFPLVSVRYFSNSLPTWAAEDCEKKSNPHGFRHDTQGTKGSKSICSVFFSFASPQHLFTSVLPKTYKFHWEKALAKLSPEFVANLSPGQLFLEATVSRGGGLYLKQEILIDAGRLGINSEAFRMSASSNSNPATTDLISTWRTSYVKALAQSFLDQTDTPAAEYALKLPSPQPSNNQVAQRTGGNEATQKEDEQARLRAEALARENEEARQRAVALEKEEANRRAEALAKENEESRRRIETLAREKEEARQRAEILAKENEEVRRRSEASAKAAEEAAARDAAQKELALREANKKIEDLSARNQASSKPPQASDKSVKRKALLIGNDKYQNVTPLRNARTDAQAMGQALTKFGYKVWVKTDLNRRDMQTAIRQFRSEVEGGDEVVIFYAGHAVQIASANYLLPTDIAGSSEDEIKDEAIQLQRLLEDMGERKTQITLALIDACRDNPFQKSGRNIGGRGLAPTAAATGQMIIFSAGVGQQALDRLSNDDKDPNGLFTRIFIREMKNPGVRVDNLAREVRKKVVEAAKSVGHDQVPAIYDQVVGDFYFSQ
jgi:hypothetical protein